MKPLWMLLGAAVLTSGCGQAPPTLAGGKPVSYWVQELHNPDGKLRRKAVQKLGNVGPNDETAFPALVEALQDPDANVRGEAVLALLKFGPRAREAVSALEELRRHDPSAQVRAYATRALAKIRDGRDPAE